MVWYFDALLYFWGLFKLWISTMFVVPFQNLEMLWLLIPIWIAWFFAEFFQEKHGTSMGNAITNAVVVLWGSVDCTRQTVNLLNSGGIVGFLNIFARFALIGAIFAYGVIIVVFGLKGNKVIKYIGRVREVTYVFAMFAPVFYGAVPFSVKHLIATLLFFPVFYFAIELIDRYMPDPVAVKEDEEGFDTGKKKDDFGSLGGDKGLGTSGSSSGLGDFGSTSSSSSGSSKGKTSGGLDDFKF